MTSTTTTTVVDTSARQSAFPFLTSQDTTFTEERHNADSDGDGDGDDMDVDTSSHVQQRAPRHNNNNQPERIRKRKKPTLNCLECVERKSKCDRARPSCLLW